QAEGQGDLGPLVDEGGERGEVGAGGRVLGMALRAPAHGVADHLAGDRGRGEHQTVAGRRRRLAWGEVDRAEGDPGERVDPVPYARADPCCPLRRKEPLAPLDIESESPRGSVEELVLAVPVPARGERPELLLDAERGKVHRVDIHGKTSG